MIEIFKKRGNSSTNDKNSWFVPCLGFGKGFKSWPSLTGRGIIIDSGYKKKKNPFSTVPGIGLQNG